MQLVLAILPTAIFANMRTPLRIVEEQVGWSTEILLPVRIVTFAPIVNGRVTDRTEGRLVAIEHEFVIRKHTF